MILFLTIAILLISILIVSKFKQKKEAAFPKEYLEMMRNRPRSTNY